MKEYLADRVREARTPVEARNLVREYLQARILDSLQRAGAMVPLAFQGGTALRLLYGLPRYSQDLDFTLERPGPAYDLRAYLGAIKGDLVAEAYAVELRVSAQHVVHSAFVRFAGLLHELGLSPHPSETVAVKIEVDTNPPAGAVLMTTLVRRQVTLHLQHHDRASLLAGKLHAILQRPYTKGRDICDLTWYLSDPDWPPPNLVLLNNALVQTGRTGDPLTPDTWRTLVRSRLASLAWDRVAQDVRPFLERASDVYLLTPDNVLRLLA